MLYLIVFLGARESAARFVTMSFPDDHALDRLKLSTAVEKLFARR